MTTDRGTIPPAHRDDLVDRLQSLADRTARLRHVHGLVLAVESDDGATSARLAVGDAAPDSPYFIASATKMFTAAVVRQLVDERRLRFDDRVVDLLADLDLTGLHRRRGVDTTADLRVDHLLRQTSGLGDYFSGGVEDDLVAGHDRAYSINDVVELARSAGAGFAPGDRNGRRAAYSDTNYQLLTAIIEAVTGESFAGIVKERIAVPLGLTSTYVFDGDGSDDVLPLHHRDVRRSIPQALASERGAGGVVSTLADQLRFSRAFHAGELFEPGGEEHGFNRIFFPVDYGLGLMRYRLPRWMTGWRPMPELLGHSGSTGSFLFHAPELGWHVAGTFNQLDSPARPFRLLPRIVGILEG